MEKFTDVAIIGGGIIGCAIAYYLCKLGCDVTVFDQGSIGCEASSAAAGLLAPLGHLPGPGPFANLLLESNALFPSLVAELEESSGIHLEYDQCGTLRLLHRSEDVERLRTGLEGNNLLGYHPHWLTGKEACEQEPLLKPDLYGAFYVPEEAVIRPTYLVKAFATAAAKLGTQFVEHTKVTGVKQHRGKVLGLFAEQVFISCRHVVFAVGAWGATYGKYITLDIPVSPLRGQILTLRQPTTPLRHIIFEGDSYLVPRLDGTIVVGATKEKVGFEKRLTSGGILQLLEMAIRTAPQLENAEIDRMWLGLRPQTPDGQPILGQVDLWENVTLAMGHNGLGILLSPITGQSVAQLIVSGEVPEIIRPFAINRFTAEPS